MTAEEDEPAFWRPILLATRPKTLLAAVVPVWLGFALGASLSGEAFDRWLFGFTLASTLAIQIATNFFNDAIDAKKGADTAERLGPQRMAGSGVLSPASLLIAGVTMCMIAITFSLILIAARGWIIVAIGVPSLFFTFGYTGGPWPLAYRGLGEVFVLLFFGLIAVAGAAFVQSGQWWAESLLLGVQVGLLATVLIAVNNARDIDEDRRSGKRTLASKLGIGFAKREILACCVLPYLIGAVGWFAFGQPKLAIIPFFGIGFSAIVIGRIWSVDPGPAYNKSLGLGALALLNFAVLVSVALFI